MPRRFSRSLAAFATTTLLLTPAACSLVEEPQPPHLWSGTRTYIADYTRPPLRAELTFDGRGGVTGTIDPVNSPAPGTFVTGRVVGQTLAVTERRPARGRIVTDRNTYTLSPDGKNLTVGAVVFTRQKTP